jgi:hypothetical protein
VSRWQYMSNLAVKNGETLHIETVMDDSGRVSPVREYRTIVKDSGDPGYVNRVLVATPTTGLVRIEWVQARYGQIIPMNWSQVQMLHYMNSYMPLRYQVADAQNVIVKELIDKDFEWLLLLEHDTVLPPDAFVRFNEYMREAKVPVVSGLYYSRSRPSEPLVFRGRGTGVYTDWKQGDRVWVDGVPTGCLLIHGGILRAMWAEAEEYTVGNVKLRRVFDTPRAAWYDPESGQYNTISGTSDLQWSTNVMNGHYFKKSGWDMYEDKKYPFLIDTNLRCSHINPNGEQFP